MNNFFNQEVWELTEEPHFINTTNDDLPDFPTQPDQIKESDKARHQVEASIPLDANIREQLQQDDLQMSHRADRESILTSTVTSANSVSAGISKVAEKDYIQNVDVFSALEDKNDVINGKESVLCCEYCSCANLTFHTLSTHLFKQHAERFDIKNEQFSTKKEQKDFIKEHFNTGQYSFISLRARYSGRKKSTTTFRCNQFRNAKEPCLAYYKEINRNKKKYLVEYYEIHSHNIVLDKIRLGKDIKHDLISKLKSGKEIDKVWREILKQVDLDNVKKLDLVGPSYLRYLRNTYVDVRLSENDLESLQKWRNIIKKNGLLEDQLIIHNEDKEGKDFSFIYMMQTKEQRNIVANLKFDTIMIDSSFGTNLYNYTLVPFFILDEKQAGFPIAFAILSNENTENLITVIQWLVEKNPEFREIKYLMSDLAPVYMQAWSIANGPGVTWLYCTWNFYKAVIGKITLHYKDTEQRDTIQSMFILMCNAVE
eukprot:GAHX01000029.1.p1 GENE.GAHX01000029.1~~GAHX01000029.1.p1  ORF type:complete len:483 (+),score=89.58 GAHX01000029.1:1112-2560(+)